MFAHGFNIHSGASSRRTTSTSDGRPQGTRPSPPRVYQAGGGVPALFAVIRTPPGGGDRVLAYARPRQTRAGVLETTFAEETETDLFGEQASSAAASRRS